MNIKQSTRKTLSTLSWAALACVATAGMATAQAQSVTLADLISSHGTLTTGDKLFSNFNYEASTGFPTAADIQVKSEVVGGNNGIEFDAFWHANPGQIPQNANITDDVTVTDPIYYISDIHLDADPSLIGTAGQSLVKLSASTLAHDSVLPSDHALLQVYQTVGNPSVINDFAFTTSLQKTLTIETTILQSADSLNANPSVLHIQESFTQAVPEPSTYALSMVGLVMMGLVARRKGAARQNG
jgi:hypothetical protein